MEEELQKLSGCIEPETVVEILGKMCEEIPTKIRQGVFLEACSDIGVEFREVQYLHWRIVWMIPMNTGALIWMKVQRYIFLYISPYTLLIIHPF